jgi:hypothetical protein
LAFPKAVESRSKAMAVLCVKNLRAKATNINVIFWKIHNFPLISNLFIYVFSFLKIFVTDEAQKTRS